jgi:hypothetical protein
MSYISTFGPTSFEILIRSKTLSHCIQLTPDALPPDGKYTLYVGRPEDGVCSGEDMADVGSVTLNEDGGIVSVTINPFGGHTWTGMTGSFDATDGTGSGTITDASDPTGVPGQWSAGGGGQQLTPERHHKHSHHA